jgi:hypothetical protein
VSKSSNPSQLGAGLRSLCEQDSTFLEILAECADALEQTDIPYVLVGGLASAILGRPRFTRDIDLLVRPRDAREALAAFERRGFETEETNPHWIFKAFKSDVMIDVLFTLKGGVFLDDRMYERSLLAKVDGGTLRVAAPEDLVVTKAIAHDESSSRHWHDALGVIASCDLDWPYLLERAQHGVRRVLALLIYAQADDFVVPESAIEFLYRTIYEPAQGGVDGERSAA